MKNRSSPTCLRAWVQVGSEDLKVDGEGRLAELPRLLDAVSSLHSAMQSQFGRQVEFDLQPFSRPGSYGFEMRTLALPQEGPPQPDGGLGDPFRQLVSQLETSYQRVQANAKSDSPLPTRDIGVTDRELRVLRELGRVGELKVCPCLEAPSGTIVLPAVELKFLGQPGALETAARQVDAELTGVAVTPFGDLKLELGYHRRANAPSMSLQFACDKLVRGSRAVGVLRDVDGALEFVGELVANDARGDAQACGQSRRLLD